MMRTFTLAAAVAVLATAGTAAYVASPAFARMGEGADHAMPDRNATITSATSTWADAKAKADKAWTRLDVNGDGKLDQADRDAKMVAMFDRIDANHDGTISKDEFLAHHRTMMGGARGGSGMMGHGPGAMLAMADTNHDGTITRAEYDASVKAMFDKADANHDGKVTREERRAAFMQMHRRDGESMPKMDHGEMDHGGMSQGGMSQGGMSQGGHGRGLGGDGTLPPPPADDQ